MSQIRELWDLLPHPSSEHVVRLFARIGDNRVGDFARTAGEMVRFCNSNADKNCYLAPNPTRRTTGIRHTTNDVTHWSWFFIDIDPVEDGSCPNDALQKALMHLGEWGGVDFTRRPPIILDSGRGLQAWIRLDDVILTEDTGQLAKEFGVYDLIPVGRPAARKVMGYWLKRLDEAVGTTSGCRVDTSCSDLPRLMRMPGTVNHKTGRETKLLVPSPAVFTGLAHLLTLGTPARVFEEMDTITAAEGAPWQTVYQHLTLKAQKYLMNGKQEPGRHETLWHTLTKLKECGIGIDQARAAVVQANKKMGEEQEISPKEIEVVVKQVYVSP